MSTQFMSLDEQERWAYANGDVALAGFLRVAMGEHDDVFDRDSALEEARKEGYEEGYAEAQGDARIVFD